MSQDRVLTSAFRTSLSLDDGLVHYEALDGVAVITLNRPEALNAINMAMRDLLWMWLGVVRDDPDVRVVVFRGTGGRGFCAGADVKEFGTAPSLDAARRSRRDRDVWGQLLALDKPVIVAMHGWCLGAGCELSLLSDLRIAADNVRIGLPEVTLGYIPSAGGTQTLPRVIPPGIAMELVLSGEPVTAGRALALGLVHELVQRDTLDNRVWALARALAVRPPAALAQAKRALREGLDLPLPLALANEQRLALAQFER